MKRFVLAVLLAACAARTHASSPPPVASSAPAVVDAGVPALFFGDIAVKNELGASLPGRFAKGEPLRLVLRASADEASWTEIESRVKPAPSARGTFAFVLAGYPAATDALSPQETKPSFVIDWDEPSVQAVHALAQKQLGERPSMDALARFVDGYIDQKDMQRLFDVASRVAAHKEGDCSEHAVLLAALGRSFGHAARVAMGVALVVMQGQVMAFGHAWVEYFDDARWRVADAAIPPNFGARYVPLAVLRDEGPAFARAMADNVDALLLREVTIEDAR